MIAQLVQQSWLYCDIEVGLEWMGHSSSVTPYYHTSNESTSGSPSEKFSGASLRIIRAPEPLRNGRLPGLECGGSFYPSFPFPCYFGSDWRLEETKQQTEASTKSIPTTWLIRSLVKSLPCSSGLLTHRHRLDKEEWALTLKPWWALNYQRGGILRQQ